MVVFPMRSSYAVCQWSGEQLRQFDYLWIWIFKLSDNPFSDTIQHGDSGFKCISNVHSKMATRVEEMSRSHFICLPSVGWSSGDPYHFARSQSRAIGVLLGT